MNYCAFLDELRAPEYKMILWMFTLIRNGNLGQQSWNFYYRIRLYKAKSNDGVFYTVHVQIAIILITTTVLLLYYLTSGA